jgi:hypothetical protein
MRLQAVNALVNLATRGASDVRRALVSAAAPYGASSSSGSAGGGGGGGGSGLWALLSVAALGGAWWDLETVAWALQVWHWLKPRNCGTHSSGTALGTRAPFFAWSLSASAFRGGPAPDL